MSNQTSAPNGALLLAGRILLAVTFVMSGFNKIGGFEGTVGYITSKGLPLPQLAAIAAIVIELGAGLMVIAGWKTRWAAAAIAVFTAFAAFLFHNYWAVPPEQVMMQRISFWKNVSIVGGWLYIVAVGAGPFSIDKK